MDDANINSSTKSVHVTRDLDLLVLAVSVGDGQPVAHPQERHRLGRAAEVQPR